MATNSINSTKQQRRFLSFLPSLSFFYGGIQTTPCFKAPWNHNFLKTWRDGVIRFSNLLFFINQPYWGPWKMFFLNLFFISFYFIPKFENILPGCTKSNHRPAKFFYFDSAMCILTALRHAHTRQSLTLLSCLQWSLTPRSLIPWCFCPLPNFLKIRISRQNRNWI